MVWLRVLLNKLANIFFEKAVIFSCGRWQFFSEYGLKNSTFYSKVNTTTFEVEAAFGQSLFVKLDEGKKFYGEDEREVIVSKEVYR